jgi:hypothetical protein
LHVVSKIIMCFAVRNHIVTFLSGLFWFLFDLCERIFAPIRRLVWIPFRLTNTRATRQVSSPAQIFILSWLTLWCKHRGADWCDATSLDVHSEVFLSNLGPSVCYHICCGFPQSFLKNAGIVTSFTHDRFLSSAWQYIFIVQDIIRHFVSECWQPKVTDL